MLSTYLNRVDVQNFRLNGKTLKIKETKYAREIENILQLNLKMAVNL